MANVFRIVALAVLSIGASLLADEPFGVTTVPAPNSAMAVTWERLQREMRADERTVLACRTDPRCGSRAALRFIAIVDEAKQYGGLARIGHINRSVNLAIQTQRNGMGSWKAPLDALSSPGDCKSYAVTKYAALGAVGIAPEDRRLVMVWDNARPTETHLIVVVRVEQRWLILDNRSLIMIESTRAPAYQPLLTLDHSGARSFPALPPVGGPL